MKRWFLGLLIAGVAVVGIVALMGGPRESLRTVNDARALAALPQRAIGPMLEVNTGSPDLVVFQDGAEGWFELDLNALPSSLEIGFHGPRLIDMLGAGRHVSIYCGGSGRPGKIIWIVQDGEIAHDFAFCNPRRMDLGPLRDFAEPVEMVTQDLSRDDVLALAARIEDDADLAPVALAVDMSELTHRRIITLPHMWFFPAPAPSRHELSQALEAAIQMHLGGAQVRFNRRPGANPNFTLRAGNGQGPEITGMAVRVGNDMGVLEGLWGEPMILWIDCVPDACARLDTLDLTDLIAPGRDIEGLRRAFQDVVIRESAPDQAVSDIYPTLEQLEDDTLTIGPLAPVTYQTRHIVRLAD